MTSFTESEERRELRRQVARLASKYGRQYFTEKARSGGKTTDLWLAMGKNGYLGVNIPEEYGGGGRRHRRHRGGLQELAAQGCPLLMMVVEPGHPRDRDRALRHTRPEAALAPGNRRRHRHHGVRRHRARCRHRTPTTSPRPAAELATSGC